jgi:hypothetical protein
MMRLKDFIASYIEGILIAILFLVAFDEVEVDLDLHVDFGWRFSFIRAA